MKETVRLGYSSSRNVTFRGEIETDIPVDAWADMPEGEQADFIQECVNELVDVWVIEP